VTAELSRGHEFEQREAKECGPMAFEPLPPERREDPVEGIDEERL